MVADSGVVIKGFHLKLQINYGVILMQKVQITYSSIPETAKRVGISPAHYYREMNKGNLPRGTKIGGRRVVADSEVDAILQGGDNSE